MTQPMSPENRTWRIVQELQRGLTEEEVRKILRDAPVGSKAYGENSLHHYIEYSDGPITIGRPMPEIAG